MRSMLRWDGRRDFTPATQHCCWRQTDRRQQEGMTVLPAVVCVCMEIYKYMYVCIDTIVQHTQENCRGTILQLPPTDVKLEMNDLQNELEQWHTGTSAHTHTRTHTHTHTAHIPLSHKTSPYLSTWRIQNTSKRVKSWVFTVFHEKCRGSSCIFITHTDCNLCHHYNVKQP